jgi:CubicO group peptidase (beta-lactamase class C family)
MRNGSIRFDLTEAVERGVIPGAVVLRIEADEVADFAVVGNRCLVPEIEPMSLGTVFDIASLTKVTGTWPAALCAIRDGSIGLKTTVGDVFGPQVIGPMAGVSVEHLLTHTSGISGITKLHQYGADPKSSLAGILGGIAAPGSAVEYTNRSFILLGMMIEEAVQSSLDLYCDSHVWKPLGMTSTTFNPDPSLRGIIAPTECFGFECLRGRVHDENAALLGGIAGHAGVFSNAADLGGFVRAVLNLDPILGPSELLLRSFTPLARTDDEVRGLAWGRFDSWPQGSTTWGHLGFTGTSIWLDLHRKSALILLTNRVHPSRNRSAEMRELRKTIFSRWRSG